MTVNDAKQLLKSKDAVSYMHEIMECYRNNKQDLELRNLILLANINLIYLYIRKYSTMECFADLEQESKLALLYSIDTYDPSKGYAFSTHVKKNIQSVIYQYFIKNNQIYIPENIVSLINKYKKENISDEAFIKKHNISEETLNKVKKAFTLLSNTVSLDEEYIENDGSKNKYLDLISVNYNFTSNIEKNERKEILIKYITQVINETKLKNIDKNLIIDIALNYFGFNGKQLSNKELADKYNIEVTEISHIIFLIKRSLKSKNHQKNIREQLGIPDDISNENVTSYLLKGEEDEI